MWKAALAALAKGVLSGLGAKVFSNLFGSRPTDFSAILIQALQDFSKDLKKSFSEELNKREVEAAVEHLRAAQRKVRQYNLAPKDRKDVLDEITTDLSDCISVLNSLDERAFGAYTVAVSLEVAIIQERAKRHTKKELAVICDTLSEAVENQKVTIANLTKANEDRFSGVHHNGIPTPGSHGEPTYWEVYYRFDGEVAFKTSYPDDASANEQRQARRAVSDARDSHIAREWDVIQAHLNPLIKVIDDLIEWAKKENIDCTDSTSL